MAVADLELSIRKTEVDAYGVELRFYYEQEPKVDADSEEESKITKVECEATLRGDLKHLWDPGPNPAKYSQDITDFFFQDPDLLSKFLYAVNRTKENDDFCRIRLFIGHTALELQKLSWELLLKPDNREPLSSSDHIWFSRYLFSGDFRPVQLRPRVRLQVQVLIAVSTLTAEHIIEYNLPPLDGASAIEAARSLFSGISCDTIGADKPLTLTDLWGALRPGNYDILYLVGHGTFTDRPAFFIERGEPDKLPLVGPQEFVDWFSGLLHVPRLVVLGSCKSGFTNKALGPRLVEAGIPAVIAMQGDIALDTFESFAKALFSDLATHGVIDQAVSSARAAIRDKWDFWVPTLFSRLKDNRIWFTSGFHYQKDALAFWDAIVFGAQNENLVPIIGPRFGEYIHGDFRDLARRIVLDAKLPRLLRGSDSFPQVCQALLAVKGQRDVTIDYIRGAIVQQLRRYHLRSQKVSEDKFQKSRLEELLWEIRESLLTDNKSDPKADTSSDAYGMLAEILTPIFVTTTRDTLLYRALRDRDRTPQVVEWPWAENLSIRSKLKPTVQSPIVCHFFGTLQNPHGLVLTEDDYFKFLVKATTRHDKVPKIIITTIMNASLAFLGFNLTDWSLRVLLNILTNEESHKMLHQHKHVAVQLTRADDVRAQDAKLQTFIRGLFPGFVDLEIFWGRPEDFLDKLVTAVRRSNAASPTAGGD